MSFTTILIIIGQFIKVTCPNIVYIEREINLLRKKRKRKGKKEKKFEYYAQNYHFFHAQVS